MKTVLSDQGFGQFVPQSDTSSIQVSQQCDGSSFPCSCRSETRRAAAAVEMALILPLLTAIVLACVDFGRFAHTYIAISNAARAGAGYAIMNPFTTVTQPQWEAAVRGVVVDEIQQLKAFDANKLNVVATRTVEQDGLWRVRVRVTYPFEAIVAWPGLTGYSATQPLGHEVVLRGIR